MKYEVFTSVTGGPDCPLTLTSTTYGPVGENAGIVGKYPEGLGMAPAGGSSGAGNCDCVGSGGATYFYPTVPGVGRLGGIFLVGPRSNCLGLSLSIDSIDAVVTGTGDDRDAAYQAALAQIPTSS